MTHIWKSIVVGLAVAAAVTRGAPAQTGMSELAKASQNPIGTVFTVPLQQSLNFGQDGAQTLYGLELRGFGPMALGYDLRLIPRLVLPFSQMFRPTGNDFGMGDTRLEVLLAGGTPFDRDERHWGFGPAFIFPTATDDSLGGGKWAAGLSYVQVITPGRWVMGLQLSQLWSYAGKDSRPATSPFLAEPFVNYNLNDGWAIVSEPKIHADWQNAWSQGWSIPLGGGVAKTWGVARGATTSLTAYGNFVHPHFEPAWMIHAQVSLLQRR